MSTNGLPNGKYISCVEDGMVMGGELVVMSRAIGKDSGEYEKG